MVPLNEEETMLDLMKALDYPVVLVSRIGLGAINHVLLSINTFKYCRAGVSRDSISTNTNHLFRKTGISKKIIL